MRYVIIAMLVYVAYLVIKSILNRTPKDKTKVESGNKKRSYDLNQVQDAEFREVNKDPS